MSQSSLIYSIVWNYVYWSWPALSTHNCNLFKKIQGRLLFYIKFWILIIIICFIRCNNKLLLQLLFFLALQYFNINSNFNYIFYPFIVEGIIVNFYKTMLIIRWKFQKNALRVQSSMHAFYLFLVCFPYKNRYNVSKLMSLMKIEKWKTKFMFWNNV